MLNEILNHIDHPLINVIRTVLENTSHDPEKQRNYRGLYWRFGYYTSLTEDDISAIMEGHVLPKRLRYRHFTVPKKDGSERALMEPGATLKEVQKFIKGRYLSRPKVHPASLAFQSGLSIADHAWAHAGANIIITADIQDFFPNTHHWRVYEWWMQQTYWEPEAKFLTKVTTYRGGLPQGAPTSPALSNLVNHRLDTLLYQRTKRSGGTYTRYADDMVFSWPDGYSPPSDFEMSVRATIRQFEYTLHPRKGWHVWYRRDEPEVTGVILTKRGGVDVPDSMRAIMKTLKRTAKTEEQKRKLAGYEGYRKMIRRR